MSLSKWIFGKKNEASKNPVSPTTSLRLAGNQVKIVEALRKKAARERDERIKFLKNYQVYLNNKDKKMTTIEHDIPEQPVGTVKFPMPCTVTREAGQYLDVLKNKKKARNLILPDGLKHGAKFQYETADLKIIDLGEIVSITGVNNKAPTPDFFGIYIDKEPNSDKLFLYYSYPITPFALRSPLHKDQGGLTTKLRMKEYFKKEERTDA